MAQHVDRVELLDKRPPPISSIVIKLNYFIIFTASFGVLPYIGVFLTHYARATSTEVGTTMLLAALIGTVLNLTLCSLADRFRAHKLLYLAVQATNLLCSLFLLYVVFREDSFAPQTATEIEQDSTTLIAFKEEEEEEDSLWFYLIASCMALTEISLTIMFNLSDSFAANIAGKCGESFGTIRVWGSIGSFASAAILLADNYSWLPFLGPSFILFATFISVDFVMILLWPDERPFEIAPLEKGDESDGCDETSTTSWTSLNKFSFTRMYCFGNRTVASYISELPFQSNQLSFSQTKAKVELTKSKRFSLFDSSDEDAFRNIRRCSLAPLGESYVVKQFELENKSSASTNSFRYVTAIEPNKAGSNNSIQVAFAKEYDSAIVNANNWLQVPATESRKSLGRINENLEEESNGQTMKGISLKLHLKIIQLIAERNKNMLRFMFLYFVVGFVIIMNWNYLFPYMNHLDKERFRSQSPYVMVSVCLSEALFFAISPKLTKLLNYSVSLSAILFAFSLRFSLYLIPAIWPTSYTIELFMVFELLHSISQGWFYCVFNESAIMFAQEARDCVPKLIELGLIDGSKESVAIINNSVNLTLLGMSSCCFDGFGMALGSIVGGWIADCFGYEMLWMGTASVALTIGLLNILVEIMRVRSMGKR